MADFLHTMVRITDPEKSRTFYEALGFTFSRDFDIVRDGEREATNYFFSIGDQENVLELTFNHDGRAYEVGTGYGHIAIGVDDLDGTLARLKEQGIEPEREPYRVREGGSRLAFVKDPDQYRVELIEREELALLPGPEDLDPLRDRLPAAPFRVGRGDNDAVDVGADDGAFLVHRQRRPICHELVWHARLLLTED